MDGGSQKSFIIEELKLGVIGDRSLAVTAFEESAVTSIHRMLVRFTVISMCCNARLSLTAFEAAHFSPQLTAPHDILHLVENKKLLLADPTDTAKYLPIEILIGGDKYWHTVKDTAPIRLSSTMVLIPFLGWNFKPSGICVNTSSQLY